MEDVRVNFMYLLDWPMGMEGRGPDIQTNIILGVCL